MLLFAQLFWLLLLLFFPALTQWGEKRYKPLAWVGAMTLCYLLGLALGNTPGMYIPGGLLSTASEISVSLAIPAMLFTTHPRQLLNNSRPALLAFGMAVLAACIASASAFFLLGHLIENSAVTTGMLASVYIGGTPNMGAVGIALGVRDELFLVLNSADIVLSGLYFGFLLTIGPALLGWIFPKKEVVLANEGAPAPWTDRPQSSVKDVCLTLLYAVLLLGLSAGITWLMLGAVVVPVFILLLTVLSLLAASTPPVRRLKDTYGTAYYLLLIFAISIGSLANFSSLIALTTSVLPFAAFIIGTTLFLHYLFCRLAGLDRDISIIASTAGVFGPPFIGPVAERLKRPDLILTGIMLGMLGYALGNFIGIGLARLLAHF